MRVEFEIESYEVNSCLTVYFKIMFALKHSYYSILLSISRFLYNFSLFYIIYSYLIFANIILLMLIMFMKY